VHSVAV